MGRNRSTSGGGGGFRNSGRRRPEGWEPSEPEAPSYPQLSGDNSVRQIRDFIEANTSYTTDDSLKKVSPEVLQNLANRIVEFENEYGKLTPDGADSKLRYNGRLSRVAAHVFYSSGTIEVGSTFKTARGVLTSVRDAASISKNMPSGQRTTWWNISASASRDSMMKHVITHEMAHSLQRRIYDKAKAKSGSSVSYVRFQVGARDAILKIARDKHGLKAGYSVNSTYANTTKRNARPGEFYAEAMAGYHSGQRDPVSLAAKEWTDMNLKSLRS